jgi:putative hydrolase
MRIAIDTHTHSVASGHAYSTVEEMAEGARRAGLKGFVLTDHGPALAGLPHLYHFGNLRILPKRMNGVRFYSGVEANIMNTEGELDLPARLLCRLDFVMAGLHDECFAPRAIDENTKALTAALRSPLVDAVSHPGNPQYPIDAASVVATAKENGKAIEINAGSFRVRKGSEGNCLEIALLCARMDALIVCGSDAHYWRDVGRLSEAIALLKKAGVPRELVINAQVRAFEDFIARRRAERGALLKAES